MSIDTDTEVLEPALFDNPPPAFTLWYRPSKGRAALGSGRTLRERVRVRERHRHRRKTRRQVARAAERRSTVTSDPRFLDPR